VVTGTYNGPIALPMTGLGAAPVIGNGPIQPGHTDAEFGVFVIQRAGGPVTQAPTATFSAAPATIAAGQSATLSWGTAGATGVVIDGGVGGVGASGTRVVTPASTTTYTLTASNASGVAVKTVTVSVTGSLPQPTSADGTMAPPAAQIVDSQGAVWTIGAGQAILRNGVLAAAAYGPKILWTGGVIYVFGLDNNWWKWTGSGWTNIGPTQPGGSTTTPPSSTTSPEGTTVPDAPQIVDTKGAIWTLDGNQRVLRNGIQAAGGSGVRLLWTNRAIYVLGHDNSWWRWLGSTWSNSGPTQPAPPAATTNSRGSVASGIFPRPRQ
jgi:hypothetical protein